MCIQCNVCTCEYMYIALMDVAVVEISIISSCVLILSPHLKHCITKLALRLGLTHTYITHKSLDHPLNKISTMQCFVQNAAVEMNNL